MDPSPKSPLSPYATQIGGLSYQQAKENARSATRNPDPWLDQYEYGICGPVALLHAVATETYDGLEKLTKQAYLAEQNSKKPTVRATDFGERQVGLTAILSAHLLNKTNNFLTYHATHSTKDYVAGGSYLSQIEEWAKELFPDRMVQTETSYLGGALKIARNTNPLWESKEREPLVFASINAQYIQANSDKKEFKWRGPTALLAGKGHFIRILSPFKETNEGKIEFRAYTWGSKHDFSLPLKEFKRMLLATVVAT